MYYSLRQNRDSLLGGGHERGKRRQLDLGGRRRNSSQQLPGLLLACGAKRCTMAARDT
ncbi:hypothetical protein DPMN_033240 [Dreissena polymorpha]|uniref:Uncharacterized protein n=1 Tax=Dreissena polymorpha TaxID=45954 RepID=A0A9D4RIP3_DREPO|nr:hypothetical protein DPMN_033240 [Dreissena polymorpha]